MKYQLDDVWIDKLKNTSLSLQDKRRLYRVIMVLAIGICYSFDSVFLYLFYKAGTVGILVFYTFNFLAISHIIIFSFIHWFGISENFKNTQMTIWQLSYAIIILITCMILESSLSTYFLALIFIVFSFAIIRITILESIIMWIITTLLIAFTLNYFNISNLTILYPSTSEKLIILFSYSSVLLRIILLGYYNTLIKEKLFKMNNQLEKETRYDTLTKTYNRKSILDYYHDFKSTCKREKTSFCVVMIDLDNFKNVNDTYGHIQGDIVLHEVAKLIQDSCKDIDKIGRYGGEEFLLLLKAQTQEEAFIVIERVRQNIENKTWENHQDLNVTISCGLYFVNANNIDDDLIKNADLALYQAKEEGRNKIICF